MSLRQSVIVHATSQLHSLDPLPYWEDACAGGAPDGYHKLAWCGVFALWSLRQAGLTDRVWHLGKGFIWCDEHGGKVKVPYLPIVHASRVAVGDIAYFDKPFQHYALVADVDGESGVHDASWLKLIAGNTPDVDESWIRRSKPAQYYSIANLVKAANGGA